MKVRSFKRINKYVYFFHSIFWFQIWSFHFPDPEINKVRGNLFLVNGTEKRSMVLPEPEGQVLLRTEKVYVPSKDFPDVSHAFSFCNDD